MDIGPVYSSTYRVYGPGARLLDELSSQGDRRRVSTYEGRPSYIPDTSSNRHGTKGPVLLDTLTRAIAVRGDFDLYIPTPRFK